LQKEKEDEKGGFHRRKKTRADGGKILRQHRLRKTWFKTPPLRKKK